MQGYIRVHRRSEATSLCTLSFAGVLRVCSAHLCSHTEMMQDVEVAKTFQLRRYQRS